MYNIEYLDIEENQEYISLINIVIEKCFAEEDLNNNPKII